MRRDVSNGEDKAMIGSPFMEASWTAYFSLKLLTSFVLLLPFFIWSKFKLKTIKLSRRLG